MKLAATVEAIPTGPQASAWPENGGPSIHIIRDEKRTKQTQNIQRKSRRPANSRLKVQVVSKFYNFQKTETFDF